MRFTITLISRCYRQMPSRVDLTLSELQEMAARQQQQIEQQQQMLVAKEQRVKFLKQQEQRHLHIAGENDRLRKLRERVEAQEAKLRKLRQLRGEATGQANTNSTLGMFIICERLPARPILTLH